MPVSTRREFLSQTALSTTVGVAAISTVRAQGKSPIKIGQIGVGHAHANKLSVYRDSPDYEVVGIVEPDEALRRRAQTQAPFRDGPWLTREQLLSIPGLQAVLVETQVKDLLPTAEACIVEGKHVHIDKPAGESLPQLQRILKVAEEKKLLVQMGYMYRYNPAVVLLRKFLNAGWLGDVYRVHAAMGKVVSPAERRELEEYRGGIMFEIGCHVLDLVIGILGQPASVSSVKQHVSTVNDTLLDNMLAVLTYPKAIGTVESSAVEVNGFDRRHLVVCGTKGTFHIQPMDTPVAQVALDQPQGEFKRGQQEITFPRYERYIADAADMAAILRGEKPCDFSYLHDLIVQETLLAVCGVGQ